MKQFKCDKCRNMVNADSIHEEGNYLVCNSCKLKPEPMSVRELLDFISRWESGGVKNVEEMICFINKVKSYISARKEDSKTIMELMDCLQWYVDDDDTNMNDDYNMIWIKGKERAIAAIANAKGLHDER